LYHGLAPRRGLEPLT